ncbi:MAG: Na(+)/H(+) antiporter subunit B [Sneathiellaceae bacterium]
MENNLVLRVVIKFLLPFAMLFALYVQFHGEYSPGGGFQAGVILAASVILYALIFGLRATHRVVPQVLVETLVPLGVLIFAGVGVVNILLGGNFLDYNTLDRDPVQGQHYGILLVELGVLVTVAGVMLAIFYFFAGRRRGMAGDGDEDGADDAPDRRAPGQRRGRRDRSGSEGEAADD